MKVEKKKHEISEGQGKVVCVEKREVKSCHEMVLEHSSVLGCLLLRPCTLLGLSAHLWPMALTMGWGGTGIKKDIRFTVFLRVKGLRLE